jgi:hypothetical protein
MFKGSNMPEILAQVSLKTLQKKKSRFAVIYSTILV